MDIEFSDFKVAVAETNRAYQLALECARDVLRRTAEVDPASRSYMIESVVQILAEIPNSE